MRGELRFGPYRLAGPQGPLRNGDALVALPPKPLALLWLLVCHAGEVVTKAELLAAVWPELVVTEGAITTCLRELRRALKDDTSSPRYIATAHRIGYRFIAEVTRRDALSAMHEVPVQSAIHFVGRELELARLHTAFAKALGGKRQIVFVSGEAGIGKTELVDAFVSQLSLTRGANDPVPGATSLHTTGMRVGRGQCVESHGAGEPYLPVLEALGRLCRQRDGHDLVDLLRRHAPSWLVQLPGLLDDADYAALQLRIAGSTVERMQREMVEAIEIVCAEEPLVLVFEDMHWSDRSTVDWLAMLAHRREAARLLVIATCRPVELILGQHPLKQLKQDLVARSLALDVRPAYLAAEAVQAYVERRLPSHAEALALAVYRRSRGHPLFMVHIADDCERQAAGGAGETPPQAASDSLRELIEAQFSRLDPRQQAILEAASVAGAEFAAASVEAALQLDPQGAESVLEALAEHDQVIEARGLAAWQDGTVSGHFRFRHDLYREALYQRMGAARRVRAHARIGERLVQAYGERAGEIAAELASHFEHAREPARAAHYCCEAGGTALRRRAYGEAATLVETGLALLGGQPPGSTRDRTEVQLRLEQGAALLASRGFSAPEVEQAYVVAQAAAARLHDSDAEVRALYGLWHVYSGQGVFGRAREAAERLAELARERSDPVRTMLVNNMFGPWFMLMGQPAASLAHIEGTLALYDLPQHRFLALEYGVDPAVACHHYAVLACWALGRLDEAERHVERGRELAQALSFPFGEAELLWADSVLSQDSGDLERLDTATERLIALCVDHGFPLWLAGGRMLRGAALAGRGQQQQAIAEANQGLREWRATGMLELLPHALGVVASVHMACGQVVDALRLLDEALALVSRTGECWYEAELHRLRGEVTLLMTGISDQALRAQVCFERALDIARAQQARLLEQRASTSLARLSSGFGSPRCSTPDTKQCLP